MSSEAENGFPLSDIGDKSLSSALPGLGCGGRHHETSPVVARFTALGTKTERRLTMRAIPNLLESPPKRRENDGMAESVFCGSNRKQESRTTQKTNCMRNRSVFNCRTDRKERSAKQSENRREGLKEPLERGPQLNSSQLILLAASPKTQRDPNLAALAVRAKLMRPSYFP